MFVVSHGRPALVLAVVGCGIAILMASSCGSIGSVLPPTPDASTSGSTGVGGAGSGGTSMNDGGPGTAIKGSGGASMDGSGGAPMDGSGGAGGGASNARGMDTPWVEYQAEDGQTNATVIGPSRIKWDANHIESEAIGRRAVRLSRTGDFVSFKLGQAANSIVVRFSIPDAPGGGGIDATLGLYVNETRVRSLPLTSRYAWSYKGALLNDPIVDKPADQPHTFFDEVHALLDALPAGAQVKLQKDAQDSAAFYVIDLVDFEQVPPPATMPAGFTSVTSFGVVPDDGKDHGDQILTALKTAKKLWFPKGTYIAQSFSGPSAGNSGLDNPGIEVRGAGMWYTTFTGAKAVFFCVGATSSCVFGDFAIFGNTKARAPGDGVQQGFGGPMGKNSLIENIWIEHEISAIWVGGDPPYQKAPTDHLTIRNCRMRNLYANGVNLANGTSNSLVENSQVRNSGDEAFVVWPIKWTDWVNEATYMYGPNFIAAASKGQPDQGAGHGNTFRKLSVQMPWRAQCFGVYGGYDNLFSDSLCEDVLTYPGILIDNEFSSYPFSPPVSTFRNITLMRAGGIFDRDGVPDEHAALEFYLREGSISDVLIENVDIVGSTYAGIGFQGSGTAYAAGVRIAPNVLHDADTATLTNITLHGVTTTDAGGYGIEVRDGAGRGSVSFQDVRVTNAAKGALNAAGAPATFFKKISGNVGW